MWRAFVEHCFAAHGAHQWSIGSVYVCHVLEGRDERELVFPGDITVAEPSTVMFGNSRAAMAMAYVVLYDARAEHGRENEVFGISLESCCCAPLGSCPW